MQKRSSSGATSGIGKKMAELYIEKGYRIGITGRRLELLQQIQQQSAQQTEYECFDVTGKRKHIPH
ncbi:MAG: SDR family NAD(P)-dependent oxidoreductase [Chitinophagaceae bacterium]